MTDLLELVRRKVRGGAHRHVHVEPLLDSGPVPRPPVRLDKALECHAFLEVALEPLGVGAAVHAVFFVVAAHEADTAGVDCGLERGVIELPGGLVVDDGGFCVAIGLLVVEDVMLERSKR